MTINAPDLRTRPPRSPRVRLGGYVLLPRLLDKGRATIAGTNGEYNFNCPMDQRFLEFAGVNAEDIKGLLAANKGDQEVLAWIEGHARHRHPRAEIDAWSRSQEEVRPDNPESQAIFARLLAQAAPHRKDVVTWFELLDLDDHVTFGGKA